jgi:lipoprotein NlpD
MATRPVAPAAASGGASAAARPVPASGSVPGPVAASVPPPVPAAAATAGPAPAWRWPARGEIIGRYVGGDQTRQGINIAGQSGQEIAAAADGVVVYSGAGLVGYGELIIIKHSDEWLSAYAHNRRRLVNEGARVKAGQAIAEMGRTGAVREMLHFEIRRNGKPVDPLQLLPVPGVE